jgi:hypothetical protein
MPGRNGHGESKAIKVDFHRHFDFPSLKITPVQMY